MWVIDFEASGLSKKSYPIEVGITNGESNYQALIKPMQHWTHWDYSAQAVHHIPREKIVIEGIKPDEVARSLNQLLQDQIVYCDSLDWDGFWCNVLFSDNAISKSFEIRDIQELLIDSNKLEQYLNTLYDIENSPSHRKHQALADAQAIHHSLTNTLSIQ